MEYCLYYQAQVKRKDCWFLVGVLRSFEHMAFDRTIDKKNSIFEFFVSPYMKEDFEHLMNYFLKEGIITNFQELENRLKNPDEIV